MFSQISILGVGLLGASLAMAVRKHCCASTINVWARKKTTLDRCAEEVWCDQVFEDVKKVDLESIATLHGQFVNKNKLSIEVV